MHHFTWDAYDDIDEIDYWKSRAVIGHNSDDDDDEMPEGVYAATKLAAILHCVEWNKRYPGIPAMVVNPGAVNSDIWRGFPSWMRSIFANVYLTTEQGSAPLVAAAVQDDWNYAAAVGGVVYLQPYWIPSLSLSSEQQQSTSPMIPFTEMLGPYIGYAITAPRLLADGGQAAARMLWQVSEVLVMVQHSGGS